MDTPTETTGMMLKLERVANRVTATSIGHAMKVGNTRISHIEGSAFVTPETAARYRAAIATCVHGRTSGASATEATA